MATWDDFINRTQNELGTSVSSRSDQKALVEIAKHAQLWNIPVKNAMSAKISTLRRIVKPARKAMWKGDKEYLEKLLEMAATMTVAELKIALDLGERETIEVTKEVINDVNFYSMKVTEHQLQRLRKAMQMTFQFVEI